jgi:hypothetical protein
MLRRALRAEVLRLLRDPVLLGCLGVAFLPAAAIITGLPDGGAPAGASGIVDRAVATSLLAQSTVLPAVCGAVRTASAYRAGIVARDVLMLRLTAPFWMRAGSSAVTGAAIALLLWALVRVGARLLRGVDVLSSVGPDGGLLVAGPVLGVGAALWGTAVGAIVRAPLAVLPVAVVSLSSAMLLSSPAPELARVLPLGAALHALGFSGTGGHGAGRWWAATVAAAWLVVALGAAFAAHRRRPLLG